MKAITLIKTASYLYHNEYDNEIRHKLYKLTEGKHPQDEIKADLSEDVLNVVYRVGKIFENQNKK